MRAVPLLLATALFAGCVSTDGPVGTEAPGPLPDPAPFLGYVPVEPDATLDLLQHEVLLPGAGVDIHLRIVRPETAEPVPVIVQFTPYTANPQSPGPNVVLDNLIEPVADCGLPATACMGGLFESQFVRRGYAFAYGDVRGTGDSSGCLDLRGPNDIADAAAVIEFLGSQPWSNGKVGFIGASYPGSEAHMAAIAEAGAQTGHLGGVIPVVASTSFYHYHHNDGVPYNGNHALGGTNSGYTQNAAAATTNVQNPNYVPRTAEEATCPHPENMVEHGGLDQSGDYYQWWQERNLRGRAKDVTVPVLMAQGLADWNVKPDHIAHYFNDLAGPKTLIAGQWGHQYPRSLSTDCDEYDGASACDPHIPWGDWWMYATAFFDTVLKGIDTGMFTDDVAWVQDSDGTWHRSTEWPIVADREEITFYLQADGTASLDPPTEEGTLSWFGCPHDRMNRGVGQLATVEAATVECDGEPVQELVFETAPFEEDTILSGVPLLTGLFTSETAFTHLVVVVQHDGERDNYGYLNPNFRNGLEDPEPISPGDPYRATIDLYPQEDFIEAGDTLRIILRSNDEGRTIESYEPGMNSIAISPDANETARIVFPVRPAHLQGVRLA
jgi:putative CocE/NonD family hydrolase